jgi:hypothetical protein
MKTLVSHIPAKLMSLLLAIVMVIPIATVSAGAVMYPADPNNMSIQTYTLGGGNASAYSDANLSSRIGAIYSTDRITITAASGNAVRVVYPVSGGSKTGWIPVSAVSKGSLNTGYSLAIKAACSAPLYRHASGGETIGTVAAGDVCYVVFADNNRAQAIMPTQSGFKMGWIDFANMDAAEWRAVGGGRTIPDGKYKIYVSSNHCVDGAGGDNDVHVWETLNVPQQDVQIRYCGNGQYSVQFCHSGLYMDVCGASSQAANVWSYQGNGSAAQRWYIADLGGGRYEFFAACSGLCLDVAYGNVNSNGAEIDTWRWHGQSVSFSGGQSASQSTAMSDALYGTSGGRITCGFDGYTTTAGRHEGIDFAIGAGHAVYSLTDGVITRVAYGSSSSLSTIAVYYPQADKTIVYLHTAPLGSLYVGENVARGQQIATESSRGASAAHTHVEVRNGRRTAAAVSRDSVLENENPAPFWQSLGYTVR